MATLSISCGSIGAHTNCVRCTQKLESHAENKMHAVRRRRILMELNQGVKLGSGARAENQRCVRERELIWNKRRDNTFGFVENRKRSWTLTVARNHSQF